MIVQSLQIAQDLMAVRYRKADPRELAARCVEWLAGVDAEDAVIRSSGSAVAQKLDMLDKAKDRVRAVLLNCGGVA